MKPKKVYQYNQEGSFVKGWRSISDTAKNFDVDESVIRKAALREGKSLGYFWTYKKLENFFESDFRDEQLAQTNQALSKSLIKSRDKSRIHNKQNREHYRYLNALEAMGEAILAQLKDVSFGDPVQLSLAPSDGKIVIVQVSDTHFNELIDMPQNQYDFYKASQRLQKYATRAKEMAKGAKKIVVALTGDLLNSDRRLDEILSQATNRMKAALISSSLLSYFINDLASVAPVDVLAVTGNESRIHDEWGLSDALLTDNYDYLVFNLLKPLFSKSSKVSFIDSNPFETILSINGLNILFTHGTMYKQATQDRVQKTFGRHSARGITLDYILFGHVHFANIGDIFARSGSLSGSNTYSEYALDLVTKASQNLHVIHADGSIDNMRVDLHNTDNYNGYPIKDDIEAYNAIGSKKAYEKYIVVKINEK